MMYGVSSMTAPLQRVALRSPGASMMQADAEKWHYGPSFDAGRVARNHSDFAGILGRNGIEILWMTGDDAGNADAVFTYDASLVTPAGAILMNPGKDLRQGEQTLHRQFYEDQSIPILGEVSGAGRAEAGDTLWLDERTLAVGRGFRTNQAGIDQLTALLEPAGVAVMAYDMPVYGGASACLHLMSLVSLVDDKVALVCEPLLPVALWQRMQAMNYRFITAPFDEFERSGTLSLNVLAMAPGRCVMVDGYPETKAALEAHDISVEPFDGEALCIGCEGGPTCMTRPILRR